MSTLRSATYLALLGGLALGTGCIAEGDDVAGDDENVGVTEQDVGAGCSPWVCGSNDPYLSVFFHELSEKGAVNAEGLKLLGIEMAPGDMWSVDVVNGKIWAKKPGFASTAAVAGKRMRVVGNGKKYWLNITWQGNTNYYPVGSGVTPAYRIKYVEDSDPDQVQTFICSNPGQYQGEYDTLFQDKFTVVLFEGERYNATTKRIVGYDNSWFNVGCAGHVLAKMHLTHHSSVGALTPGYATTANERQTMMKMYTADYCKDGTSFTIGGEKLSWKDDHGWLPHYYPVATLSLEARWDKDGPICLETPRLKGSADPLALFLWPGGVDAAITARCPATRPPTCSSIGQNLDPDKTEGAHLTSANPP